MKSSPKLRAESAADRALAERPSVSIRLRIAVIMALSFLLTASVTVAWVISVQELGVSQQSLERLNRYVFELEQARRFEKNFLLYGTNIDDALEHVEAGQRLLVEFRSDQAEGGADIARVESNVREYGRLVSKLSGTRKMG